MRLIKVVSSTAKGKRYAAVFEKDGKTKTTNFGQKDPKFGTYIDHKSTTRRSAYLARHSKNNEDWNDPTTAGALAKWLLWGKSTSLRENIKAFKRRFNL